MAEDTFIVNGRRPLAGTVKISGSKNAVLPIIAASLLSKEDVVLRNVPRIEDVFSMIELCNYLGATTDFTENVLKINAKHLELKPLTQKLVKQFRASILLLSPVLSRKGSVEMIFPGGCVIGRRSIRAHINGFRDFGVGIDNDVDILQLTKTQVRAADITMWEPSVTATENMITFAACTPGTTTLRLTATEPHIQDLCHFLNSLGANISGIGTPFLEIEGVDELTGGEYTVTGDYLEAGTFATAGALLPGSHITIEGIEPHHLDAFWNKMREVGVKHELHEHSVEVWGGNDYTAISKLDTRLYPYFPTDLHAPFAVLLTQAKGTSRIFETLFEGRLNYLYELEKMGANMEILNPHQATVEGPVELKGTPVASCDIRAGAAVVLAALAAHGTTEISKIYYIDRGYENFEDKLTAIGADIKREN